MNTKIIFGRNVRTLRKKQNWTLRQVEVLTKISTSRLSQIELGRASPGWVTISKLCEALHVMPSLLFRGVNFRDEVVPLPVVAPADGARAFAILDHAAPTAQQATAHGRGECNRNTCPYCAGRS
jgi:transcriptional regulator with XRE-family HTH domain